MRLSSPRILTLLDASACVEIYRKWYSILLPSGEVINAGIKGKLRLDGLKTTNPVAAGDRVLVEKRAFHYEDDTAEYAICDVLPRDNYIVRKSTNLSKQMQIIAANIDRMYLVVTLKSPVTQLAFVDRMLVSAESFRIPVTLLFNKIDLLNQEELLISKSILSSTKQSATAVRQFVEKNLAMSHFKRGDFGQTSIIYWQFWRWEKYFSEQFGPIAFLANRRDFAGTRAGKTHHYFCRNACLKKWGIHNRHTRNSCLWIN